MSPAGRLPPSDHSWLFCGWNLHTDVQRHEQVFGDQRPGVGMLPVALRDQPSSGAARTLPPIWRGQGSPERAGLRVPIQVICAVVPGRLQVFSAW